VSPLPQKIRFHLAESWRYQRFALALLLLSAFAAASTVVAWAVKAYEVKRQEAVVAELREARKRPTALAAPERDPVPAQQAASLGKFSSQQFTAQFHETAAGAGLPVDEVAYSLEHGESQPYMRYRVTLTVKARYLDVRKFIAALAAAMPHVALDSIRCVKEMDAGQPLSCEMAFSAFFLKD
jgi:hypothetical protein